MTYYVKGGSRFNAVNPKTWSCLFLGGFPDADYLDINWKNLDDKGHENNDDPFWRMGGSAGGAKELELGLWNDYRIKFETTGITYWDGSAWENLLVVERVSMDGTPTDDTYMGIVLNIDTTGCAIGDAVYVDGTNSVLPADADSISTMPAIGIVVAVGKVLTHGVYRDDSVLALATASKVYVSTTPGDLTTSIPGGVGDIVQVFGITVGADMIFVNPSLDWVERK